jgi:hypothetical protein
LKRGTKTEAPKTNTWGSSGEGGNDEAAERYLFRILLRVPQSIVLSVRFLCIAGYCLASSLLFSAFVSIELRILCAVVHTEGTLIPGGFFRTYGNNIEYTTKKPTAKKRKKKL